MNLDVDSLIMFYKKNTKNVSKKEFKEQDAGGAPSGGSGKTPKKWDSGIKRGKANPIDQKSVWKSELVRGKANSLYYDL